MLSSYLVLSLYWTLREKCPYSKIFWSLFSRIRTEYREMRSTSPYSVQMHENTGQKNSEYGQLLRRRTLSLQPIFFVIETYTNHGSADKQIINLVWKLAAIKQEINYKKVITKQETRLKLIMIQKLYFCSDDFFYKFKVGLSPSKKISFYLLQ